ncbi:uncharacterized protein [Sinocyclocheilus grahami]|uniref:uncharacterized protein n=1 Tax=Sinocyclocheilus grahami TaxID=75366 RepID=UPI0007AD3B23|nr:PREDICTED: uncharacterized protein LOC107553364 [Sinocyclocheilus grahami]
MEKVIFFCIFSSWIMQTGSSDVSEHDVTLLRVQLNKSISLNCNMTDRYEIAWFHQYSQQLNQLLSAKTSSASGRLLVMYNQNWSRLNIDDHHGDVGITTVMLVISGVTESDSGLYFCGTKSETSKSSKMHFDKPIRLQIEDKLTDGEYKTHSVTDPPEDAELTDGVTTKERALMFGGVGLAALVFFLATVIAGGIIHYRGWQKGWTAAKRSSLMNHKSAK